MEQQDKCKKCNIKCGLIRVSPDVLRALEDGYQKLSETDSNSLLKKYLTKQIFDQLKNKKTSFGSSLLDCVQSGYANHDSVIGIYAPDPEAYLVFSPIFDPIIENYHVGFSAQDKHPKLDWGDLNNLENLDPNGEYIISTRVRCCRSIEGYPFNACMNESHYREIEAKMKQTFINFTGDFEGQYISLVDMTMDEQNQLIDEHFLFKGGDKFLLSAKSYSEGEVFDFLPASNYTSKMSFEEDCEILLKPSTELIPDEYAHNNETASVHIFIFKEKYEALFVDSMKLLGYSVPDTNIHLLSTRTEVLSSLQKICDESEDNCSLILLFWGPFRSDRKFLLKDASCIKMMEIWNKFISSNCLTLREKPKIFIFNGFHEKHVYGSVGRHMENLEEDTMRVIRGSDENFSYNIPAEGDILIVFKQNDDLRSSVEYMNSLCSNFQNLSEREDIFSLLTITDFLSHPILISTMTRKFYLKFNPNRGLQLSIREKYNKIEEAIQKMRENILYLTKDEKKVRDVSETLPEVPDSTNDLKKASSTEENLHRKILRSEGGLKFRPRSNTASRLIDIEKLNKPRADNRPPWKF